MIATNVRRLSVYLVLAFASVSAALVLVAGRSTRRRWPRARTTRRSSPPGAACRAARSSTRRGASWRPASSPTGSAAGPTPIRRSRTSSATPACASGRPGWSGPGTTSSPAARDPNPLRDLLNDILDAAAGAARPDADHRPAAAGLRRGAARGRPRRGGGDRPADRRDPGDGLQPDVRRHRILRRPGSAPGAPSTRSREQPDNPFLDREPAGPLHARLDHEGADRRGRPRRRARSRRRPPSRTSRQEEVDGFVVNGLHDPRARPRQRHARAVGPVARPCRSRATSTSPTSAWSWAPERYLDYARALRLLPEPAHRHRRAQPAGRAVLRLRPVPMAAAPRSRTGRAGQRAFGQAAVSVTPLQMALRGGDDRQRRGGAAALRGPRRAQPRRRRRRAGPTDDVLDDLRRPARRPGDLVASAAAQVRQAMIDAVSGPIGRAYAGPGDVTRFGVSGVQTAGKTGTAERGPGLKPHSWFIGFAPAQGGGHAVDRDRGHRRGRRPRLGSRRADRWRGHGRVAEAARRRQLTPQRR